MSRREVIPVDRHDHDLDEAMARRKEVLLRLKARWLRERRATPAAEDLATGVQPARTPPANHG